MTSATVRSMADRVVWLSYGEIKDEGDAGEVTATYAGDALGERHEDEGEHEFRFGSGEVVITHVSIIGPDGEPDPEGEDRRRRDLPLRVRGARCRCVSRCSASASITSAARWCPGPNTRDSGDIPAILIGPGTVDITIRASRSCRGPTT